LDRFCGEKLEKLKEELAELIAAYREISRELKTLQGAPGQREAQIEIWQFQIDEISEAQLKPGEEESLEQKRNRLSSVERISKYAQGALYLLYGGNFDVSSATDQVGKALQQLTDLARLDESKQPLADRLTDLSIQLADIVGELSDYSKNLDADPYTLERVETRLDVIYRLKKKYGGDVEDILAHLEKITAKLEKYVGSEGEILRLNTKRREAMQAIASKCNEMTNVRRNQAELIQERIVENLRDLGMKNVQFSIAMEKQAAFNANGNDRLEFMISPNLGESLKPLSQIASGGEMSRVMLALKTVMADVDKIGTLIFDEIDAGVSGRTAQQVAEKLAQISGAKTTNIRHQILCITHLPQIAAMADKHFLISKGIVKGEKGEHTLTFVQELNHYGIIEELARLIGGAQITESTLRAAEEMKALAKPSIERDLQDSKV
ncbi:MAG: DNA repair protein RecN, partial [Defluviitaleaceae bacterium]|nr:DNA repair protein RecN [Defluviitaleaceae bacterium]